MSEKIQKSNEEWKAQLSPEEYRIMREKGTERAFTGRYWNHHGQGVYKCAACGNELFISVAKFESGTGWPSFFEPARPDAVDTGDDDSLGMRRTEVACDKCGAHLGHLFPDGPRPTGLRYCVDSASLRFEEKKGS